MGNAKSTVDSGELMRAVQVQNKQRRLRISHRAVALFCVRVLRSISDDAGALSVAFVNARQMRAINAKYLRHDYATDVLSFSYKKILVDGRPFLGEIVIAPEVAANHARRYRTSPEKELRKLLVHGILHLLGYNHETDDGRMSRLQRKLLRRKLLVRSLPLTA